MRDIICLTSFALLATVLSTASYADGISVFHRSGQTFITWTEKADTGIKYNLYRSDNPITDSTLKSAEIVAGNIPSGTGIDLHAEQAKTAVKIQSVKDPLGPDWFHQVEAVDPADKDRPATGIIIDRLDQPIPAGTGLYVRNIKKSGDSYYAVTAVDKFGTENKSIVPGVNSTLSSIKEIVAIPEPILVKQVKLQSGYIVETYNHWSTPETAAKESIHFKFQISIGPKVSRKKNSPLMLMLHSAGGPETLPVSLGDDFIMIAPNNYSPGFMNLFDWWYGYNSEYFNGTIDKGININYTENRLLYLLDWIKSKHRINTNRIYLGGVSMGGTGTLSFGLRHPEIFSAIYANVPDTNTGDGISIFEPWFESMWGKRSAQIKTNEGINLWDRLNMTEYVRNFKGELPFVKTISARDDVAMPWQQIPPFLNALNDTKRGFVSGWGTGGHNLPFENRPSDVRRFNIYNLSKNVSYPAFSNSSINDNPESEIPIGQMGGGFDWQILADLKNQWSAEIRVNAENHTEAVTDITLRRLQKFKVTPGVVCIYTNAGTNGSLIQDGDVTVDSDGFITLHSIKISDKGSIITVKRK